MIGKLKKNIPAIIIGAAFIDIILGIDKLPLSGEDVLAQEQDRQVGGCAFNIARALARLDLEPVPAILLGNGYWGEIVEQECKREGLSCFLRDKKHDNGWCLSLVESDLRRTFISVNGCEQHLSHELIAQIPELKGALIYASGYELENEALRSYLLSAKNASKIILDLGPRVCELDLGFFYEVAKNPLILSLNKEELETFLRLVKAPYLGLKGAQWAAREWQITLIARLDKNGCYGITQDLNWHYVPAFLVDVADDIGAGDAHAAGLIAGLMSEMSIKDCLHLANALAGVVVSKQGASGAPNRLELAEFFSNAKQKEGLGQEALA